MGQGDQKELIDRVRAALEEVGVKVRRGPERRVTVWELGPEGARFVVSEKGGSKVLGVPGDLPTIRVKSHWTKDWVNHFIETEQAFADASGNAWINAPGLFVHRTGQRPEAPDSLTLARAAGGREWRGAALRVVFHLLCDPKLADHSVRNLASFVGVSNTTVDAVLRDLRENGQLIELPSGGRRLTRDLALTNRWTEDYARKLRPTKLRGTYTTANENWHRDFDPVAVGAVWGGESAAEVMGADLRPGIRTLYVEGDMSQLAKAVQLRADPNGAIEVRQVFWNKKLPAPYPDLTPLMLTVADLTATREPRCISAAAELLQQSWDA